MNLNKEYNLALNEYNNQNYDEAIKLCDRIIQKDKEHYHSWNLLGNIFFKKDELDASKDFFIAAINLNPNSFESYYMLGNVLFKAKYYEDSINIWKEAIKIKNNFALTYANIAASYHKLEKTDESIKYCLKTFEHDKNHLDALACLAKNYQILLDLDNCKKYLLKILKIDKYNANASFDLSYIYLYEENYLDGFKHFEERQNIPNRQKEYNYLPFKVLENNNLTGKSLLIYHEQGFGDNIQFIRFLANLKCKNISVGIQNSLNKLFSYNFPSIKFLSTVNKNDSFDYMTPLMSLAYYLKIDSIDNSSYLNVDKNDIKVFKDTYLSKNSFNLGINWQGSKNNTSNLVLKDLSLLFKIQNINFYSLQVETNENLDEYNIIDLGKDFKNFYDTAIAMKAMDLIISIDSSVAHLSGALGKKTFLLYEEKNFDFRWRERNNTSIWYNSIKIHKINDLTHIVNEIEMLIRNK